MLKELHDAFSRQAGAKAHHFVEEKFAFLDMLRYTLVKDVLCNSFHARSDIGNRLFQVENRPGLIMRITSTAFYSALMSPISHTCLLSSVNVVTKLCSRLWSSIFEMPSGSRAKRLLRQRSASHTSLFEK